MNQDTITTTSTLRKQCQELYHQLLICKEAYESTPARFNNARIKKFRNEMYLKLYGRYALAHRAYREHEQTAQLLAGCGLLRAYDSQTETIYL